MERTRHAPWPLVEVAVEARCEADAARLARALVALQYQDRTFRVVTDPETRQTILGGISEAHLDATASSLRRRFGLDVNFGAPQVAYREKLCRRVEQAYTHRQQIVGAVQFAHVAFVFEPNEPGAGNSFETQFVAGAIPEDYMVGIENGINGVLGAGVLAGFPLIDVKATLVDGAYHEADSSVEAFEFAARAAFRTALQSGGSILLEPIMEVEVTTPEDYAGVVTDDFSARGICLGQRVDVDGVVIMGLVSLANVFGYANQLRSMSQGRATFTMRFAGYRPVPPRGSFDPPPAAAAALRA